MILGRGRDSVFLLSGMLNSSVNHDFLAEWDATRNVVFRLVVGGAFSAFVFQFCGLTTTLLLFSAIAITELFAALVRNKVAFLFANNLLWTISAVLVWGNGSEIARLTFPVVLLCVSLYVLAIYHRDLRMMMIFLAPPLLTMGAVFAAHLIQHSPKPFGYFAIFTLLGGIAVVPLVGTLMHSSFRKLEDANASKDAFLANMSHEIRTPLNGIIGLAAALSSADLPGREREMALLIHRSGETLERLLSDILDLSRIETGQLEIDFAPFDLRAMIDTSVQVMVTVAEEKGLELAVDFDPAAEGSYQGDAIRLRQIVANLTANAVKFTTNGSVTVAVAWMSEVLTVRVTDTGIGFEAETAARLFRRFEQGDPSITRRYGGTGLGLSISQAIARQLGGDITAASSPGEGSVFTLTVPLGRAEPAAEPVPPDPERPLGRLAVVVADDHPVNRRTFQIILEAMGVDVTLAENGREAVEAMSAGPFDLVLMDMQMPVMDGLAATRAIRAMEAGSRRTPIAMLSANVMEAHVEMALAAGCDFHLPKPITPQQLADGLRRARFPGRSGTS